jgi:outer membrane protein assembly factor BamB
MRRVTAAVFFLLVLSPARAENWPGWRGPDNRGVSSETGLPVRWSKTDNVRWKTPLTMAGVSQPVTWNDFVFLTASDGRLNDRLHVQCFHRDDGRLLWHTRLFGTSPTDLYPPGGMAVPTPVTDGQSLYVVFGTGDLACLDLEGKPVWIRSLAEEYGPFRNRWGMASSPILADGLLVVQVDHWSQSYLLAIDPKTGVNRWKAERDTAVNWSSPLAVKVNGQTQIITAGTHQVIGYDLQTGSELWRVKGLGQQCIPSPVVFGDLLIATSGESTLAVRLDRKIGDLTKSHLVWNNKKVTAFVPSPLVYGEHVYLPTDKGFGICLDARTGKQLWKERLGEQYHASPVAGDGMVYLTSKEGVVRVLRAGPTFELLAENDLGETIVASPAISRRQIFLRGEKHLFCIERPVAK